MNKYIFGQIAISIEFVDDTIYIYAEDTVSGYKSSNKYKASDIKGYSVFYPSYYEFYSDVRDKLEAHSANRKLTPATSFNISMKAVIIEEDDGIGIRFDLVHCKPDKKPRRSSRSHK